MDILSDDLSSAIQAQPNCNDYNIAFKWIGSVGSRSMAAVLSLFQTNTSEWIVCLYFCSLKSYIHALRTYCEKNPCHVNEKKNTIIKSVVHKYTHTLTYTPVAAAVRIKIQSVLYGDSNSFIYLFFLSWMNRIVFFISFQLNHSSKVNFITLFSFVYLLDHLGVCIGSCMSFDLFETTNTK